MAERCVGGLGEPVTYLATWRAPAGGPDPGMEERVARHQERRPPGWSLRELDAGEDLPAVLGQLSGAVLVDSLGTWVAGASDLTVDADALCDALGRRSGPTVVVSEEVGLGVHPATPIGRRFREVLGPLNEAVAAVATEVWFVMAGRALPLGPSPWGP